MLTALLAAALLASPAAAAPAREASRGEVRRASARAIGHYLAARSAEAQGDFRTAVEELRLALIFDESSAQIRVAHAEVLARLSRLDEAEREAQRAVALDAEGEPASDAWLLLGKIAAHRRDPSRAAQALRNAAALELRHAAERGPDEDRTPDPEPWRILGRVLLEAGDEAGAAAAWSELGRHVPAEAARGFREMARTFREARDPVGEERALRRAVELFPGDAEAWKRLGQVEERRRHWGEARSDWELALRADPEDLDALEALGRLSLRAGDVSGARAYFRQLRALDPDDGKAVASAAMAFLEAHRPEEALEMLAVFAGPPDPRIAFARGLILEDRRRWAEAAAAFAEVSREEGDLWAVASASRAAALGQLGRTAEALAVVNAALEVRPAEARLHGARALVLEKAGRAGEAVEGLARAAAERESDGDAGAASELWEATGAMLARAGRATEAVEILSKAAARRPRDEGLLYALGVAQERAGDLEAALANMRALLALNPDHAEAMNFVGYAYAERGMRLEEAEKLLVRALELRPENGFFLDSLGWVYFQRGETTRAVSALEQADAVAGPEPTILEHLGDAYRRAQRGGDAEKAYRRALRSIEAGDSQDGPERAAAQRAAIERKLHELSSLEALRPTPSRATFPEADRGRGRPEAH